MTDLTQQISFTSDTAGVEAGVGRVKKSLADVGVAAATAGKQASTAVDSIGNGAGGSSQKVESATKNLVASIQRQIAAFEAGGRSSAKFYEQLAGQRGVNVDAIRPYLDQLKEAKSKFEEAGHGAEEFGFKTAGAKRELLVLAHELSQGNFSRFGGSLLVLGERTGAAGLLFSKTTLAILGVTAALAGFGVAVAHAELLQRSLNTLATQLAATGRAGLLSTDQLKTFIHELALMPGVTREAATEVVSEFTKVHQIGGALFGDLVKITADYAKATGTEAPAAAKALAQAFADPEKGAKALDATLGTLTSTQLLQIEKMTQQNDLAGAQRVLMEALEQAVKGLADKGMTPLQKATTELGKAWEESMQHIGQTQGLKNAADAVGILLGRVTDLVKYLPEFEKKWSGAFSGGLNGLVMQGIRALGPKTQPAQTGGATGSFGETGGATGSWVAPTSGAGANAIEDDIKRSLKAADSFKSQAQRIGELKQQRDSFNKSLQESINKYGAESEQAKKLRGAIEGVNEQIAAAEKKGKKAYTDDAATRMLETLRQTEASLKAQLSGQDKLTEAQKEQAKFQQLIADLKEKKILTADQKSLLANKDAIGAQIAINVELDKQIEKKKEAEKIAQREVAYSKQLEAITRSYQSANEGRREQYDRLLSTVGLGDRARQEVEAEKAIYKEFDRYKLQLDKETADKSDDKFNAFDTDKYRNKVVELKAALQGQLDVLRQYYAADKAAREDWRKGATSELANYIDNVNNAAQRAKSLMATSLNGLTDSITGALMGDKGKGFKDLGKHIAEEITRGIVETQITRPIAQWLQSSLMDPQSLIGKLIGGSSLAGALSTANGVGAVGGDALGSFISSMGWADGGYTGAGGKYQPAGIVHAGEYVLNQKAVNGIGPSGIKFLDDLNRRGYADGGLVRAGNLSGSTSSQQAGGSRTIQVVMNVPKGTDTKTAGQWGAAAARQIRIAEARHS
jgi:lambda family phage tail tape measure protein